LPFSKKAPSFSFGYLLVIFILMPYEEFPWFKDQPIKSIIREKSLRWVISIGLIWMSISPKKLSSIPSGFPNCPGIRRKLRRG